MSAKSAVRSGRIAAQRLMIDTCVIRRRTGEDTNPDTGAVTAVWDQVYAGPCKVGAGARAAVPETPEAGEHAFVVQRWLLHLPITVTEPTQGDLVTITAAGLDPALVGRTYRLAAEFAKSFPTARRIQFEETVG